MAKLLMATLGLALSLGTGLALAASDSESASPGEDGRVMALSAPTRDSAAKELPGQRTSTSKTFLLPDGSREARIFATPINYYAGDEWQPIETDLHETADGSAIVNGPNSFDLQLPESLNKGAVSLAEDGQWVSYRLLGGEAALKEASGKSVTYDLRGSATSIELTSVPTGVKEEIELADVSQPSSFEFELKASAGLTPILADDGSLRFEDAERKLFAQLPAPTIADSAGEGAAEAVSYSLAPSGEAGSWRLLVAADKAWLGDPDRKWPVTIDPSISVVEAQDECAVGSLPAPEGWTACERETQTLPVAYDQKSNELVRTFLRFEHFQGIPKEAFIQSATLSLWSPNSAQNTPGLELRSVGQRWDNNLTWSKWGSGGKKFWTTPGGDLGPEAISQVLTSERGIAGGWWNFTSQALARLVKDWIGEPPKASGVVVKQINESKAECEANPANCAKRSVTFNSSTAAPAETHPVLKIVYFEAAPPSSKLISPAEGTRTARRLKLQSAWTVQGVTGITYQYREGQKGPFETMPPNLVRDADGEVAVSEWPFPVSGVKQSPPLYFDAAHASSTLRSKGGSLQVRAVFHGSQGSEGFSRPVLTKVDRFLGGPRDATAEVGPGSLDLLTGNFAVSRSDVSIPAFNSALEVSRTHNSRDAGKLGDTGVFGQGWKASAPVEQAGGSDWRSVRTVHITEAIEEESYSFDYAIVTDKVGNELAFEKVGEIYEAPPEAAGLKLSASGTTQFVLGDTAGNKTVFESALGGTEFLPVSVTQPGTDGDNSTQMVYDVVGDTKRLKMVTASVLNPCSVTNATTKVGCRTLTFTYAAASTWGAPAAYGDRLSKITYYAPGLGGPWDVAQYKYDSSGRLIEAWDPRISSPLVEKYTYESGGQLKTITPAGLKPWTMEYGTIDEEEANGRLMAVKRDSLVEGAPVAQTTIAYGVPINGAEALYDMSGSQVARWGQQQVPVDATAIFPPDQIPSSPPTSYSRATIHYLDAQGEKVNTATPAGAGTEAASISTTETDTFGNVVRELTPQNRLRALSEESEKDEIARAIELDTHRQFSPDGTEMWEEWRPLHPVRLASGTLTEARFHRTVEYDLNAPTPPAGLPKPHLPTRETTGASDPKVGEDKDQRLTEYRYDWTLREPTETIIDPQGLNIRTVTVYDDHSGLPIEYRQPSNSSGGGAGTTRVIYWNKNFPGQPNDHDCDQTPNAQTYGYLPCKILPVAQPGGSLPKIAVKWFVSYNALDQSTEITERPGGEGATRKTLATYDAAGRPLTSKIEGGGTAVPKTKIEYSSTTGLPTTRQLVCEGSCVGFDNQAVTTTYDTLGLAETSYNEIGLPTDLTYDKATGCAENCVWLDFSADRSIYGQILTQASGFSRQNYAYDKVGRLELAKDWNSPVGGSCTTREYKFEGSMGKDSNRTKLITRAPELGGACAESGGNTQSYSYDTADRLTGEGITYDDFGRITSLAPAYAGGKTLTTSYFGTDMVSSQTQNGVTNTFQLDSALRQRQRTQGGGLEGVEVFHYADGVDTPVWTQLGAKWSRNIPGISGRIAAIQDSSSGTLLQLTNLHGDVVGTATLSPSATKPVAMFEYDEFGVPKQEGTLQYGWLGDNGRRTEFPTGVVQMGARSYVPSLGRFISHDPVSGGSASAYDYANADPVNGQDLTGEKPYDTAGSGACWGQLHVWSPTISGSSQNNIYGSFYARYKIYCGATLYYIRGIKQSFTLTRLSNGGVEWHQSIDSPEVNRHWIGNWYEFVRPYKFTCLRSLEYEFSISLQYENTSPLGIVTAGGKSIAGPNGGSLDLKAQEFCGHGPY
jgi:RHS repeat-associated protein